MFTKGIVYEGSRQNIKVLQNQSYYIYILWADGYMNEIHRMMYASFIYFHVRSTENLDWGRRSTRNSSSVAMAWNALRRSSSSRESIHRVVSWHYQWSAFLCHVSECAPLRPWFAPPSLRSAGKRCFENGESISRR